MAHKGRNNEDLTSETLWSKGNQGYPNQVISNRISGYSIVPNNRSVKTAPVVPPRKKPVPVEILMAMLKDKPEELTSQQNRSSRLLPPLLTVRRPRPREFPLSPLDLDPLEANEQVDKSTQDPIATYRSKNYPYLQLFENGVPVFPNFSKGRKLLLTPPKQNFEEINKKVLAWKYGASYINQDGSNVDEDLPNNIERPKLQRFSENPTRQIFFTRMGVPFPMSYMIRKNSFDNADSLQPFVPQLQNAISKARRFISNMSDFKDSEITFIVDGHKVEVREPYLIYGTKKKNEYGNFRETMERIVLPNDLHIEQVHFVRDFKRFIIIEEKWKF